MKFLLIPLLIIASAFFSASETAFFALRRVDLMRWKKEGNRMADVIGKMLETPSRLIATMFIGNELVNVSLSSVIAALLIPMIPAYGEIVALAAGTLTILILGDITPKCIVWPRAKSFSAFSARPLLFFSRIVAPVRFLMEIMAKGILRLLGGGEVAGKKAAFTEREFRALVDVSGESGTLDPGERELIHNIFELTDQRAGEIMTPIADVFMVPVDIPRPELLAQFRKYRRSRIPVYRGERRDVFGILYLRDLLRPPAEGEEEAPLSGLLKPPFVVPTSKKLPLLLREFQRLKVHLALVVDEFGEIVGIVTLEDVLEELFGEIREEHDREEKELVPRPDGSWGVLGKMPIHRFNDAFQAGLPDQEWDTVAGLLLHEFGRLPGRGDSIVLGPFRFTVERVRGIRIVEVCVRNIAEGTA
ncbi:MAG TPA: hemolysin family protein [Candidatus Deferrimicrobiaceae bacterium]|jgi:CBS domain containing-hemolysin-like protein|nr:hemolysin family protein [Candidatus Deferrimicrobiaceae bacterium]